MLSEASHLGPWKEEGFLLGVEMTETEKWGRYGCIVGLRQDGMLGLGGCPRLGIVGRGAGLSLQSFEVNSIANPFFSS